MARPITEPSNTQFTPPDLSGGRKQLAQAIPHQELYLATLAMLGNGPFRCERIADKKFRLIRDKELVQTPKLLPIAVNMIFPKEIEMIVEKADPVKGIPQDSVIFTKDQPYLTYGSTRIGHVLRLETTSEFTAENQMWLKAIPAITLPWGFGWMQKFMPDGNVMWGTVKDLQQAFK